MVFFVSSHPNKCYLKEEWATTRGFDGLGAPWKALTFMLTEILDFDNTRRAFSSPLKDKNEVHPRESG